jgi:hypothetical protein
MKTKTTLRLVLLLSAVMSLSWSDLRQTIAVRAETISSQANSSRDAVRGEIFTGTVLMTTERELRLNVTPCEAKPTIITFRDPYRKTTRGSRYCQGGQSVTIEQIQQLGQ